MTALTAPVEPMLCRSADAVPGDGDWVYEPKWDGFRALVFRTPGGLEIQSRNGQPLARYFPEVVEALSVALPEGGAVVDGEIILTTGHGLDFDLLQSRLHPAQSRVRRLAAEIPASFIAFDLLSEGEMPLLDRPLSERRRRLEEAVTVTGQVAITPQTDDSALAARWFSEFEGAGLDGIVAKHPDQPYRPGERGWTKIKHLRTIDAVVGGFRLDQAQTGVASLLLGLHDHDGVLHHVGHTSSFDAAQRRRIREQLRPLEGGTSFGAGRTPGAPGRWSRGRDTSWVAVAPQLVCEVSFDHMQGDRLRHAARFIRWREDRLPDSCTFDQLDRPEDFDLGGIIQAWSVRG